MAQIPLQSIKFPGLPDTYTVDHGLSEEAKAALLNCIRHIALWDDGNGQQYYDALYNALYNGEVIPTVEYPDLTTGDIVTGSYYDASGNIAMGESASCINEKYFEIESGQTYIWIRGFNARVRKSQNTILGQTAVYRVCYYDSEKNFMARHIANYSDEFNIVEPRYYTLQPPSNAKYFRVSWDMLPIGNIYKSIPNDLYAVIIVLATLNDATIESESTITNNFSVTRNNIDITHSVVYGTDESISVPWADEWVHNIFNVNDGGSPETGEQTETQTRIHNIISFLMKAGDVIHFNGVKAAVRAEKIADGTVQHTTSWITDNSDFVIGGV